MCCSFCCVAVEFRSSSLRKSKKSSKNSQEKEQEAKQAQNLSQSKKKMSLALFRNDFGKLFDDMQMTLGDQGSRVPSMALDLAESDGFYRIKADLPGVAKSDISIDVTRDNTLVLKAERKSSHEEKDETTHYHRVERSYGAVQRAIRLPETADLSTCTAKLNDGVLEVSVAKRDPPVTTKQITIE